MEMNIRRSKMLKAAKVTLFRMILLRSLTVQPVDPYILLPCDLSLYCYVLHECCKFLYHIVT